MPKLTFLEADRPLVKTYSLDSEGNLVKESYPRVWDFTSHTYEYQTLTEFHDLLRTAASKGWCLLKGELQKELSTESRAGSTDPNTLTDFMTLDFDRLGGIRTIEQALTVVGLADVSYVVQYSASYGIERTKGCTAHVFIMLSQPVHPASLKQWLIGVNLRTEALSRVLALTRTHNAISWGLDVSTCQNDKLIYIAPPVLGEGVRSTAGGERIQMVTKANAALDPATLVIPTAEANRALQNTKLEELRARLNLPARSWNVRIDKTTGLEILARPDVSTLTGIRKERGFTYFNLNGGDSWGYYHPDQTPEVVRNFKGEPNYLTSELLPEYWSQLQGERKRAQLAVAKAQHEDKERLQQGITDPSKAQTIVFRDFKSAIYYNGTWDPDRQHLALARATGETQIQHYLLEHGHPEVDYIPVWNLIFDPRSDLRVNVETKTLNLFEPTPFMKQVIIHEANLDRCPVINKVIESAVARDPALKDHYLNWLACIFKLRIRTMTAWALHGIQGTGKGLLVNKILVPLLGLQNVAIRRMVELEDRFNGYLEYASLVIIDEAEINELRSSRSIMADLKNQITEPQVSVRKMHAAAYTVPNHCNFMFLSNRSDQVHVERTDRRINVGEYREERLDITDVEIEAITDELPIFANYLMTREASPEKARSVMMTAERAEMMATSQNSVETTTQALLDGDLRFFWDSLPAGETGALGFEQTQLFDAYKKLMDEALRSEHGVQRLSRDEIRVLIAYNVGDVTKSPAKFTQLLRHHRVPLQSIRVKGVTTRGIEVNWKVEAEWKAEKLSEVQPRTASLRAVV